MSRRPAHLAASTLFCVLALASPVLADTGVTLVAGVLTITDGGSTDDDLALSYSGGTYTLTDNGGVLLDASSIAGSTGSGTTSVTIPDTGVTGILFELLAGNDSVSIGSVQATLGEGLTIDGGPGTLSLGVITATSTANFSSGSTMTLTGNVSLADANGLLTITADSGGVAQTGGALLLADDDLELLGAGDFALSQSGNEVGTLAADLAGSLSVASRTDLTVAAAGTSTGITLGDHPVSLSVGRIGFDRSLILAAGATITATSTTPGTQRVTLTADAMDLQGAIEADQGVVTLQQFENSGTGTNLSLGGADGVGALGLSDADVDDIHAGRLQIGNGNTGLITLDGTVGPSSANDLRVTTGRSIVDANVGSDFEVAALTLTAAEGIGSPADLIEVDVDDLTVTNTGTGAVDVRELSDLSGLQIDNPGRAVILDAGGSITDGDGSPDVTAADLALFAVDGIGASANPLQTDVTRLEVGNTSSGDVFLTEASALEVADLVVPGTFPVDFTLGPGDGLAGAVETPGRLVVGGDLTLQNGFLFRIAGGTPATEYLQIVVNGSVDILSPNATFLDTGFTATGDESLVLIDNDGADAVNGSFNGLSEGMPVSVGGKTFQISYTGGDGNDLVLSPPDTEAALSGGTLTITDIGGGDSADDLTLSYSAGTYTLTDGGGLLITTAIAGATGSGTPTVAFPDTGVSRIVFDTLGGQDVLSVDSLQASLPGGFAIYDGPGADTATINGSLDTGGGDIDIAVDALGTSAAIDGGAGSIDLTTDDLTLGALLAGTGSLTIRPLTTSAALGLGGGAGALNLDDAELAFLTNGFASITIGDTVAGTGAVEIDTTVFNDPITIAGGTIRDAVGTDIDAGVNAVTLIGSVAPGQSPGILVVTGGLAFGASATLEAEIFGVSPGTEHDQIVVTGTVDLADVVLSVDDTGFVPAANDVIVLIDNDATDTVTGTFDGLPEGSTLTVGGEPFVLSYAAGDGNDVALTFEPAPEPEAIPTLGGWARLLLVLLLAGVAAHQMRR